jgi:hypothetical protein
MTSGEDEWKAASVENWRRRMARIDPLREPADAERRLFYRSLLGVRWMPLKIKNAVLEHGLGKSVQRQNRHALRGWARYTTFSIAERAWRIVKDGKAGPKGGKFNRAKADEAEAQGMSVKAMEKQLQRCDAMGLIQHYFECLVKADSTPK